MPAGTCSLHSDHRKERTHQSTACLRAVGTSPSSLSSSLACRAWLLPVVRSARSLFVAGGFGLEPEVGGR